MALSDLKDAVADGAAAAAPEQAKPQAPKLDAKGRAYGTGRRKDAAARVWVSRGNGKVTVNGRDITTYFARGTQQLIIQQAFDVTSRVNQFDVECTVKGGGLSGQAGAILHGLARALTNFEPALRTSLKKAGFLTRDSRVVERKKYGKHGARRSTQWVKR